MATSTLTLLRYAIEQRNYLAFIGLILQIKWLQRSCAQFTKYAGYGIIVVGMSLIIFCTVVLARDAVPAFATPGSAFYYFLMFLVVTISFNILFNYVCATVFTLNIGVGDPATTVESYGAAGEAAGPVQRATHRRRRREHHDTTDDSTTTSSDSDDSDEDGLLVNPKFSGSDNHTAADWGSGGGTPRRARTRVTPLQSTSRDHHGRRPTPDAAPLAMACYRARALLARALLRAYDCIDGRLNNERRAAAASPAIAAATAADIARLDAEADGYTATERRYKTLDRPRRFCSHCRRFKAPREHHCKTCGRCVPRLCHHCLFVATCINVENQRYFFLLVFWLVVGTFFVDLFIGYGWWQQRRFERAAAGLGPGSLLAAPYGPCGHKLISFPVCLTLAVTAIMLLCMALFLYHNTYQMLSNLTSIDLAIIEEKRDSVFRGTSFEFRSPYDLGAWRNTLECFRTLDDPLVHCDLYRGASASDGQQVGEEWNEGEGRGTTGPEPWLLDFQRLCQGAAAGVPSARARLVAWRVLVLCWLMALPTLRPTGCDGVHYPIFDRETRDLDGYCIGGQRKDRREQQQREQQQQQQQQSSPLDEAVYGTDTGVPPAPAASLAGGEPYTDTETDHGSVKEVMWL